MLIAGTFFSLMFLPTDQGLAHVEKGTMPAPVAEMEYRILLEFKPDDNVTRALLGMALIEQGKLQQAEKEFLTILKKNPADSDSLDALGIIRLKQKKTAEALRLFEQAIMINPADALVYLHLGKALEEDHRPQEALDAYRTGLGNITTDKNIPDLQSQKDQLEAAVSDLTIRLKAATR